jgi:hypothetical protein
MKMPYNYVLESFCDMLGASKAYNPTDWKPEMLKNYWLTKCVGKRIMHEKSANLVEFLIYKLVELGEEAFFNWFKDNNSFIQFYYN